MDDDEKQFFDEWERADLVHEVNNEITLYQATGDGRFFWRAFLTLYEAGEPLPSNFLAKFAQLGNSLLSATTPQEISAALEFSANDGRRHVGPKHSRAYEKRWRLASEVKTVLRLRPELSLVAAKRIVARNRGLSLAEVSKTYHDVFTAPLRKSRAIEAKKNERQIDSVLRSWKS